MRPIICIWKEKWKIKDGDHSQEVDAEKVEKLYRSRLTIKIAT